MANPTLEEAVEISRKGMKLTIARKSPFTSKEKLKKEYKKFMESLSDRTFNNRIGEILRMMNYGKASCERFKNSEEQADDTISQFPRLMLHRDKVIDYIKEQRLAHDLTD